MGLYAEFHPRFYRNFISEPAPDIRQLLKVQPAITIPAFRRAVIRFYSVVNVIRKTEFLQSKRKSLLHHLLHGRLRIITEMGVYMVIVFH